jgi:hypothetical protein
MSDRKGQQVAGYAGPVNGPRLQLTFNSQQSIKNPPINAEQAHNTE